MSLNYNLDEKIAKRQKSLRALKREILFKRGNREK